MFLLRSAPIKPVSLIFDEHLIEDNLFNNYIDTLNIHSKLENEINVKKSYDDIELFNSVSDDSDPVFNSINNTHTILGRTYLTNVLNNPSKDIAHFKELQGIYKKILTNKQLLAELKEDFLDLKKNEKAILWCLKKKTNEEETILKYVYFQNRFLKNLNKNETILTYYNYFKIIFTPLYGLLSPVLFFIIPYIYLRMFTGFNIKFLDYLKLFRMAMFGNFNLMSMGMRGGGGGGGGGAIGNLKVAFTRYISLFLSFIIYIQNVLNNIDTSKRTHEIINEIHIKLNKVADYTQKAYSIIKKTKFIFDYSDEDCRHCIPELYNTLFKHPPSYISNKGLILTTYYNLNNHILLKTLLKHMAKIDYYLSCCLLIEDNNYSYAKYITSENPILTIDNLWHPSINNCVMNSLKLGQDNNNNIIITGPNAGGKSTFIKAIVINIILSQTLGIAPCSSISFTPYSLVNTYLNIPDCKGKESLFEAEMNRALEHINLLNNLNRTDFSFLIMDEIFSSTNPEEGMSGGYAICEKLGSYKNSNTLITTHFNKLTKLEKTSTFTPYRMPITRDKRNEIMFTYKLEHGVSEQFIALELLKNKGFDTKLVNRAIDICKTISKPVAKSASKPAGKQSASKPAVSKTGKKKTLSPKKKVVAKELAKEEVATKELAKEEVATKEVATGEEISTGEEIVSEEEEETALEI